MRIVPASPEWIARAAGMLREGAVIAYPTDTLYGLAVDPRSREAVQRLFDVKGRDALSAIPLIAATVGQAREAAEFTPDDERLAATFWPGPLTIVMHAKPGLIPLLLAGGSSVAIRVPAHPVATAMAAALGYAVTSTSANRSGQPAATTAGDVDRDLGGTIDLVIDGGPSPGGPPSTIVEVARDGPRLIRAGAVPWERVLESLE